MKSLVWDNRTATTRTVLLLAVALAALVAVFALTGWAHLLLPAVSGEKEGELAEFDSKVNAVKGPATFALGGVSGLGLLAGGAMTGLGMPQGVRMMTMSGLAGAGVVLGRGLIA